MTQAAPPWTEIPTKSPQASRDGTARPAGRQKKTTAGTARSTVIASGNRRAATRGGGEVIELEYGITMYPARSEGGRWRAVWYENDERQQCEAATEEKLAVKLEKVRTRLKADAPNMKKPGTDLIAHYLDPDRHPVKDRWSRKHADTQRRLCKRFAAPVIDAITCQDIKTGHMERIVNAAPTAGEGDRVRRMISALVTAGIDAGYLANSRLAKVHWQAGERVVPESGVTVAGESGLWVDPAEIPSGADIGKLGLALAAGVHGDRDELMANTAAYTAQRLVCREPVQASGGGGQVLDRAGPHVRQCIGQGVADLGGRFADNANDLSLFVAQRRSSRRPDDQHSLGYGREA